MLIVSVMIYKGYLKMEKNVLNDERNKGADLYSGEIKITEIFGILLHKIIFIIIIAVVGFSLTFAYTKLFLTPMYKSSVKLSVYANPDTLSHEGQKGISYSELSAAQALANSYTVAIKTPTVADVIRNDVNGEFGYDLSSDDIIKMTSVSVIIDTFFIEVEVASSDKMIAYNVANSYSKNVKSIYELLHLGALNESIGAQIASSPYSPHVMRNSILGALIAAIIAGVYFVIRALSDTTVYSEREIDAITSLPTIGVVPEIVIPQDAKQEPWIVEDGGRISLDD